ncbi:MAG: cysteine desulfurase family protein [Patescibacteria group bacterium]
MPKSNKIYLDYASATPVDSAVSTVMAKYSKENFANPSAIHDAGVKVKKILDESRKKVGEFLGAHHDEIIFTSGATESNNLAILGIVNATKEKIPHIVTTNIEHASVLEVCKYLEQTKKASITYVEVEKNGIVDFKKIRKALKINTILVSVMYANNEIGTIQPLQKIAKEIRHYKKINNKKILFHTDATQAINYLEIRAEKLGVDLLSFNSAKIYGPKGVGVLYVKRGTSIEKIIFGGNQESDLRPGTENIVNIVGLVEALKITEKIKEEETKRLIRLRNYFFEKLSPFIINGDLENRLPNNINITIPNIPSDLLIIELSARGIMASAKSACKTGDGKASHVIQAIRKKANLSHQNKMEVNGSLRFSLGRNTSKRDIDITIKALFEIWNKLKKWYN